MKVLYAPKGRAGEYAELACSIYLRCTHRCAYCYCPDILHIARDEFHQPPKERTSFIKHLEKDASTLRNNDNWKDKPILLSFIGDCYQPIEEETRLTRLVIETLHNYGLRITILTKGGLRSTKDFDLLTPNDAYATTLTCLKPEDSLKWEPYAALPDERINALREAHNRGIETWVSFEPVIYPRDTIALLNLTFPFVGHYKVGTMNYHPHGKTINWKEYGFNMKRIMDRMGIKYYFKKDLLREMGIKPDQFEQTGVCR